MTTKRTSFWTYFYWLVFCGLLFLASEVLRMAETLRFFRMPWLDAAANYGLLSLVMCGVAAVAAAAFVGIDAIGQRTNVAAKVALYGVIFALFTAVWLNILRLLLGAYGTKLPIAPILQIACFAALGAIVFVALAKPIARWVDERAAQLGIMTWALMAASLLLTGYLFWEPLNQGRASTVTLQNHDSSLPNVVMIVLDGITSRDMSLYGYHLPTTPNLDQITQTWTVFENANSTATSTRGVMPTLLTGRYPSLDDWSRYGDLARAGQGWVSLAQILGALGYETVRLTDGGGYPPNMYHLHTGFNRVFGSGSRIPGAEWLAKTVFSRSLVIDPLLSEYALPRIDIAETTHDETIPENWSEPIYANAQRYFQERAAGDDKPFFIYLHAHRPNWPYVGNEYAGTFLPLEAGLLSRQSQQPYMYQQYPPDQQAKYDQLRLRYDENIRKADDEVGQLIETLQQLGLYDQTLIVITADHGTNFIGGQHGYSSPLLAAAEHEVPLLVKYPRQAEGLRIRDTVSTVDIMPTVLDVVGAKLPQLTLDGQPLPSHGGSDPERMVFARRLDDVGTSTVVDGRLKLVSREGQLLLFDLAADPQETTDLYGRVDTQRLQVALEEFNRQVRLEQAGETTGSAVSR